MWSWHVFKSALYTWIAARYVKRIRSYLNEFLRGINNKVIINNIVIRYLNDHVTS